jgi:8-oxo-dGTP pyrophosphatase MutT (NUDIX family)
MSSFAAPSPFLPPPAPAEGWLALQLGGLHLGWLSPARAARLLALLPELEPMPGALRWSGPASLLGEQLRLAAQQLREQGEIHGWRDEDYACEQPVADPCSARGIELFRLERAAFRPFGLMSRAVHINAWWPDDRTCCGRRALHKATDPGRLDNLAAGGLPAGENLLDCARRELWEEAGVPPELSAALQPCGAIRTRRIEPEGLHDEVLHIYALQLPDGFMPANRDGEVSEFLCLAPAELQQRLTAGEFSPDAEAVIRYGLARRSRAAGA